METINDWLRLKNYPIKSPVVVWGYWNMPITVMKYLKLQILVILVSVLAFLASNRPVLARRTKEPGYKLEICGIEKERLAVVGYKDVMLPFPAALCQDHATLYFWLKDKIETGRLSPGLRIVSLDTHLDYYNLGGSWFVDKSTWIRGVLEEGLCPEVLSVIPEWLADYPEYLESLKNSAAKIRELKGHNLPVIENLNDLPDGKQLGPIVLCVEFDYFSNTRYPRHKPTAEEIKQKVESIVAVLKAKGIEIAALVLVTADDFADPIHSLFIKNAFLEYLSSYGRD